MRNMEGIFNIFAGIVTVALVTTIVTSPQTRGIILAIGSTFANSLRAAMGNA